MIWFLNIERSWVSLWALHLNMLVGHTVSTFFDCLMFFFEFEVNIENSGPTNPVRLHVFCSFATHNRLKIHFSIWCLKKSELTFIKFEKLHLSDAQHKLISFINSLSNKLWCRCSRCGSSCCRRSGRGRCSSRGCCCCGRRCGCFRLNYHA